MWPFFLISSMVLDLLDQLQIFLTVASDRIARAFNKSAAVVTLDIQGFLHGLASWSSSQT